MARPFKQGLDYFPLEVNFLRNPKIIDLTFAHGPLGPLVFVHTLCLVYSEGYYLEYSIEELSHIIFRKLRGQYLRKVGKITEVIRLMADLDLIDKDLMQINVITSRGIQRQWLSSVQRRKIIDTSKYWLLSDEEKGEMEEFGKKYVL